MNKFKNLILFGPNGCGKTTYLNDINEKNKNEKNIFIYNKESLKDSYDGKTNSFKKEISKNEKELMKIQEKPPINDLEYSDYIKKINSKNPIKKEILIKNELEISFKIKKNEKFFNTKPIIKLNDYEVELDKAPSGVKKIISLKYEIDKQIEKNNKNEEILIIIDELENHLHPSWINIICGQIKKWIDDKNIYVMLSTHSPLVLENLKNHIEYFQTIEKKENEIKIKKVDKKKLLNDFNEYASKVWNENELENYETLLNKVNPRLVFELSKIFFSQKRKIVFVEGITDKIFFENETNKIIINIYGNHNIPYVLFLVKYAGIDFENISFILDGDNNLNKKESHQYKTQKFLNNKNIKNYYFEKDIEQDLYGKEKRTEKSFEKFNLAFENKNNKNIELKNDLKNILDN